jgi:hypothetical protein
MSFDCGFSSLSSYLIRDSLRLLFGFTSAMEEEKLYVFLLFKANLFRLEFCCDQPIPLLGKKVGKKPELPCARLKVWLVPFFGQFSHSISVCSVGLFECLPLSWRCHALQVQVVRTSKNNGNIIFYWKTQW